MQSPSSSSWTLTCMLWQKPRPAASLWRSAKMAASLRRSLQTGKMALHLLTHALLHIAACVYYVSFEKKMTAELTCLLSSACHTQSSSCDHVKHSWQCLSTFEHLCPCKRAYCQGWLFLLHCCTDACCPGLHFSGVRVGSCQLHFKLGMRILVQTFQLHTGLHFYVTNHAQ